MDKILLLKDLCPRLPYGVNCKFNYGAAEGNIKLKCIDGNIARFKYGWHGDFHVIIDPKYIKPYLRPMSSMTEDEKFTYYHRVHDVGRSVDVIDEDEVALHMEWLNEHHFDYRGLIGKGLALEAPEGMYE